MGTETIDDLLELKKVRVLEDSDFLSSYCCDLNIAERLLKTATSISRGVPVEKLIKFANPAPSHMVIYELGCGLQLVLPFDREKGTLTSSKKVVPNYSDFYKCITVRKGGIVDGELETEKIFGGTFMSRRRLIKLLERGTSTPLIENYGWLRDRKLGDYVIKRVSDRDAAYYTSVARDIEVGDSCLNLKYDVKTGKEISKAEYLEISYRIARQGKVIEVKIHVEDNRSNASINIYSETSVKPTSAEFSSEGEISDYSFPPLIKGKDLTLHKEHYQNILSTMKGGQALSLGQIGILVELEMISSHRKLDYVASIKNIIETASNPGSPQQFKPLIFKD